MTARRSKHLRDLIFNILKAFCLPTATVLFLTEISWLVLLTCPRSDAIERRVTVLAHSAIIHNVRKFLSHKCQRLQRVPCLLAMASCITHWKDYIGVCDLGRKREVEKIKRMNRHFSTKMRTYGRKDSVKHQENSLCWFSMTEHGTSNLLWLTEDLEDLR